MDPLIQFFKDCAREVLRGGKTYWGWLAALSCVALIGFVSYLGQLEKGLIVSGMSDQVVWGTYIANFTFLIGMAAAAVMLVIPAYIFHRKDAKSVVLLGEGVAVAACTMALLFVVVDLGRPDRFWHLIPFIGRFNWPVSLLAWDVIVLNVYLALNLFIPMYVLYRKYIGKPADAPLFLPMVILSMFWAISLHTVTAFLFSSNAGRAFWHTALLGPRFLASAFAAGPAVIILAFRVIAIKTPFRVAPEAIRLLAIVVAVALQINLFMIGAEVFTEFYWPTEHTAPAQYLFMGIAGRNALVPWLYSAITIEIIALVILMVEKWRRDTRLLILACVFTAVGIWIEKGMGLIVPGFVPSPLGEIFEYTPSLTEVGVSLGIWAFGGIVFTVLAKAAIPVELGVLRYAGAKADEARGDAEASSIRTA